MLLCGGVIRKTDAVSKKPGVQRAFRACRTCKKCHILGAHDGTKVASEKGNRSVQFLATRVSHQREWCLDYKVKSNLVEEPR
jgi:hypothetical protein